MNRKARAGLTVFGVGLLVAPLQVATAETVTTPAPAGSSEAVAAQAGTAAKVGYTKADADQNKGEAKATAVEVLGSRVSGGEQKAAGKSSGAIYDSKDTPLGRLQVAPWEAQVTNTGSKRTSESDAALLKLVLVNSGTARVNVLHTHSKAEHVGDQSGGNTASDGARVTVGNGAIELVLLHSETSSSAKGGSYVVGLNGTKILSSDQAGSSCVISVPGVVTLGCLNAAGGKGVSTAAVADGRLGDPKTGSRLALSAGSSQFGSAPQVLGAEFTRPDTPAAPAAIDGPAGPARDLAVTGSDALYGALVGAALLALGAALMQIRKAWETVVA